MKKVLVLAAAAMLLAGPAFADITGSAHDFSSSTVNTWNTTGEICVVCHTPHNATGDNNLLWNRVGSSSTYTIYSGNGTMDATIPGDANVGSKLCLSCHDGTVGLGNFGGVSSDTNVITGTANLGTNLQDDHPVSIQYDAGLASADGGLTAPAGGTVGTMALPLFGSANDQLECGTCHDVHNEFTQAFLLNASNAGSLLCLNCHNK